MPSIENLGHLDNEVNNRNHPFIRSLDAFSLVCLVILSLSRRFGSVRLSRQVEITVRCQPRSAALPAAHTCFFQLDVPDYDKESVLRHKLLQAVNNTSSFDVV